MLLCLLQQVKNRTSTFNDIRKKIIIVPDQGEESSAHQLARQLGWRGFVKRINYLMELKILMIC